MAERGRPRKPKADRRERQFHVMLTNAEHRSIEDAAKAEDLGASTWARRVLLSAVKARQGKAAG
jgi:hypothetical protein